MILYHRCPLHAALEIERTGQFKSRENPREVFFSTSTDGQATGYGSSLVVVDVADALCRLDDEFPDGEQHYAVRAEHLSRANIVRVHVEE